MKTILIMLCLSSYTASAGIVSITIDAPPNSGTTYSTGSGQQYAVQFSDKSAVPYVHNPDRAPAQTQPTKNDQPVPYNNMDYWERPTGEAIKP